MFDDNPRKEASSSSFHPPPTLTSISLFCRPQPHQAPQPRSILTAPSHHCCQSCPPLATLPPKSKEKLPLPGVVCLPSKLLCSPPSQPPRRVLPQPCVVVVHGRFHSRLQGISRSVGSNFTPA
ncbi:hypothetical protein PIB30_072845, partial [Stylosanthes scabra]|nr:hypothetical protein [Stylosanthes scabra]